MTEIQQEKPPTDYWGYALGVLTIALALVFAGADMYGNFVFGFGKNFTMGVVFVAVAAALVIIPEVVGEDGWCHMTRGLLLVCAALSIAAGMGNHLNSQAAQALRVEGANTRYVQAQAAIKKAGADIEREETVIAVNKATVSAKALQDILNQARKDIETESKPENGGCSLKKESRCQKAKTLAAETQLMVGEAEAKEAAQARLIEARARLAQATAQAPASKLVTHQEAKQLAKLFGASIETTAENWDTFLAMLLVTGSTIGATLFHRGRKRLQKACNPVQVKKAPAKKAAKRPAKRPEVAKFDQKQALEEFLDLWTVKDGEGGLVSGEAHNQLRAFWQTQYSGFAELPTKCALGIAMGKRFEKAQIGSQQVYRARLIKANLRQVV